MPDAAEGRAASCEADETVDSDHPITPQESSILVRQTRGNTSGRKRRRQEPSALQLRYPRKRSAKACQLCRARKTKCDNVHPLCGFCSSIGATCKYDDGWSTDFS